jgi:hypothetical protein
VRVPLPSPNLEKTTEHSEKTYIHLMPIAIASASFTKVETRMLMASKTHTPAVQNPPSRDGHPACNNRQDHSGIDQQAHYVFWISGFSKGDDEGDFLRYELTVLPEFEAAILNVLGWNNLDESAYGDCLLTAEQIIKIAIAIDVQLPTDLDLFIGVRE